MNIIIKQSRNFIFFLLFFSSYTSLFSMVFITHGMGTSGIDFYHNSTYTHLIKKTALQQNLNCSTIPWLNPNDPHKEYAGLLLQERIQGAALIAQEIISAKIKNPSAPIVLIGHGFGCNVMSCASCLLNPENQDLAESALYDLVDSIKWLLENNATKGLSVKKILSTLSTIWNISQLIISAIEHAPCINANLINFIKQHISLEYTQEIKKAWQINHTFIQNLMAKNKCPHAALISMLYTIGSRWSSCPILQPDMHTINHHIHFYSEKDKMLIPTGTTKTQTHPRRAHIATYFDPTKTYAPTHQEFCGNTIMAPWILKIPETLRKHRIGNFEHFAWGCNARITFFEHNEPIYQKE